MLEPKPIKGAKALLFERLVDENPNTPGEAQPFRIYGVAALRESVQRELARLLNTRSPVLGGLVDERDRTVIDYGIPDFSHVGPASTTDLQHLARVLEQTITAYEPRLQQVHITLETAKSSQSVVRGAIAASLVVGTVNEPVSFPLVLSLKTGEVILSP
ncbi:MAG TPA: type VI secretion system baseplate subunit TssE [Candidatus Angelobacter sp.]